MEFRHPGSFFGGDLTFQSNLSYASAAGQDLPRRLSCTGWYETLYSLISAMNLNAHSSIVLKYRFRSRHYPKRELFITTLHFTSNSVSDYVLELPCQLGDQSSDQAVV